MCKLANRQTLHTNNDDYTVHIFLGKGNKSSAVAAMGDHLATMDIGHIGGCAPLGGAGSPSNTMWPGPRPTCGRGFILICLTIWPQYTNVTQGDRQTNRQDRQRDSQTRIRQYRANCFTNGCPETAEQSSAGTSLYNLNRSDLVCENKFWQIRSLLYIFQLHRAHQENNYQW